MLIILIPIKTVDVKGVNAESTVNVLNSVLFLFKLILKGHRAFVHLLYKLKSMC